MTTYIHYGSDYFDASLFVPVKNSTGMPKPENGLWACREDSDSDWKAWCLNTKYHTERLKHFFRFTLPDAHILVLSDPTQLLTLPKLFPWKLKKLSWLENIRPDEFPTTEQLQEFYATNWCYLDYEKLMLEYDAVELRNSQLFRDSLSTWDCDCILVMNSEKVEMIP